MRLRTKGMKLVKFKITIRPFEWDLWPNWVGGHTPNIREIFFLCFRINIYLESRKQQIFVQDDIYGLDD